MEWAPGRGGGRFGVGCGGTGNCCGWQCLRPGAALGRRRSGQKPGGRRGEGAAKPGFRKEPWTPREDRPAEGGDERKVFSREERLAGGGPKPHRKGPKPPFAPRTDAEAPAPKKPFTKKPFQGGKPGGFKKHKGPR